MLGTVMQFNVMPSLTAGRLPETPGLRTCPGRHSGQLRDPAGGGGGAVPGDLLEEASHLLGLAARGAEQDCQAQLHMFQQML